MTYAEFDSKVSSARGVLTDLGIKQGDTVGVISNNRWEWAAVAAAAYSISAVMVPMYEAQLPSDWSYILNDAGCKALMCANQDIYDRASAECKASVSSVENILCFDAKVGESHAFATAMEASKGGGGGGIVAPGAEGEVRFLRGAKRRVLRSGLERVKLQSRLRLPPMPMELRANLQS